MKTLFVSGLMLLSVSAMAAFNEVECQGRMDTSKVEVEVEDWGNWAAKDATVTVTTDGTRVGKTYSVSTYAPTGFNHVRYSAAGFELDIDFWPDRGPQWGRSYRADFRSQDLGNKTLRLNCRFPNIH